MKYIVVGPTIVNDIIFADGSKSKEHIGGSIFCVEGIKIWEDDCLYVSNVGEDFSRYYGKWMDANHCSYEGLHYILPHTQYTTLLYGENGLHSERSIYGEEMEKKLEEMDVITASQIAAHCDKDTRGIYIEASETNPIWDQLQEIKKKCDAKVMWELPTSAAIEKGRRQNVLKTIKKADIYSINLPEAMHLFGQPDEVSAIQAILDFGVPCFFRVGKKGSYMLLKGKSYFAPSVTLGDVVDATGCGNCSTAAALYGWCEGFEPTKVAFMANISAAYNLLQYGPYPCISEETRKEAHKLLEQQLMNIKRGYSFFIGDVALDEYYKAPYFPKIKEKIVVNSLKPEVGGMIANAASVFAGYGGKVHFLAMLNSGPTTQMLCNELKKGGIDTSYVQYDDSLPDSKTIIILAEDEHTVFIPTLGLKRFEISQSVIDKLCGAKYIYSNIVETRPLCCGELKAVDILHKVRSSGAKVVFDLDVGEMEPEDEALLHEVDIIFLNEMGIKRFAGKNSIESTIEKLFDYGIKLVVITLAEKGAEAYTRNNKISVDGIKVNVTDVTGAGDTFCSSFIYALDKTGDLELSMLFANAAAARAVTMMGARSGIATVHTVLDFLEEKGYDRKRFSCLE